MKTSVFETAAQHPFLRRLQEQHQLLTRDFLDIVRFAGRDALTVESTAKKAIRSKRTDWKTFAFIVHGKPAHEHMRDHGFRLPGMTVEGFDKLVRLAERVYFRRTRSMLQQIASEPENGVISMWFSCFEPGAKLGLHVNNDPYMLRAHLGLIVPRGNIGFKVRDESIEWREGELFVFDPTMPHTAWNLTDQERVIFVVDFFRPGADRDALRRMEREQFVRAMEENPLSFGMSGGRSELDEATVRQYAIPEIG